MGTRGRRIQKKITKTNGGIAFMKLIVKFNLVFLAIFMI